MPRDYDFWVYILTNKNKTVLYIGMTNSLSRRLFQHQSGETEGFAANYQCRRLIYYEHYRNVHDAIARETQLKKWRRSKKVALIEQLNPRWEDLGRQLFQE
ncbi:MAG: GIY-YIG nuclease family protein [Chthoniobacterales bacterium]|nr:GIY-YIG nuclease family protein [Chthoniobacterales bacterium]